MSQWLLFMVLIQGPASRNLTLDRAIELGAEVSPQVRMADATIEQAKGGLKIARSGLYPRLTSSLSYQRTLATEFSSVFSSDNAPNTESTGNIENTLDLPFGRRNLWQVRLGLSQNIYSGGRNGALANVARSSITHAEAERVTTRAQIELDIAEAYYDSILSDRLIVIAEATLRQAQDTVTQVERQFNAGSVAEFDVLRARVDRDNQVPIVNEARANRDVAYLRLKQLIQIPASEVVTLVTDLESETLAVPSRFAERYGRAEARLTANDTATLDRAAVRAAEALVARQQANFDEVRAEKRPNITAISDYANVTYPRGIFSNFGDIRTNWTVGFSLNFPILTGGLQSGNERVAFWQLKSQRAQLELTQDLADLDARSAWAELIAAQSTWQATAGTVQLARRAHEIGGIRFNLGVGTQLELSDARLQLQVAEANRARAARNLQVARIRVALLPELPLGNVQPAPMPAAGSPSTTTQTAAPSANPVTAPSTPGTTRTTTPTTTTPATRMPGGF